MTSPFAGINVVSISVPDLAGARAWYAETLALGEPLYDLPEHGWIEFGAGGPGNISLTQALDDWQPNANVTIVLNTADCLATCAELRSRGVTCDDPIVFEGYVTYCTFYDPWGNRLQMCSPA